MHAALVKLRKRLAPLVWLLVLAVLAPAGVHLATGVVLCIGSDHVDVEVAGSSHHNGHSGQAPAIGGLLAGLTHEVPALTVKTERDSRPCLDVPLRIAGATDACHQVVKSEAPDVEALLVAQSLLSLIRDDGTDDSHPRPRSALPRFSQGSSHSTVVLLI